MLAVGIVHQHHREAELAAAVHRPEPEDSRGGLLAASDHPGDEFREFGVDHGNEVSPIVDNEVGAGREDAADIGLVLPGRGSVNGEDMHALMHKGRRHVILGGEGVRTGYEHVGAACGKHFTQMRGLGLQVYAERNLQSRKGFGCNEFLFQSLEKGHVGTDPGDLEFSAFPQVDVSDMAFHNQSE